MDLRTTYLGLDLSHPLVPSASPLSRDLGTLKRLEDAGAPAVVLYSLFEEEVTLEEYTLNSYLEQGQNIYSEALDFFPDAGDYRTGPEAYLDHLARAKSALSIPVIASLNGMTPGGWLRYAAEMEQAGADAIELNMYFLPTDPNVGSLEIEQMYLDVVVQLQARIGIPLSVKLSPFITSIPNFARALAGAGAKALVLFNRFYQPDFDVEELEIVPNLVLSRSEELRLPLRWIAILYGRVGCELALTSGVHSHADAIKSLMAGAQVAMMTSELLENGIDRLSAIVREMEFWLEEHEYDSLDQLRGSLSQINCPEPAAFERANYMKVLRSYADPVSGTPENRRPQQ